MIRNTKTYRTKVCKQMQHSLLLMLLFLMGGSSVWAQEKAQEIVYAGNEWIEFVGYYDENGNSLLDTDGNEVVPENGRATNPKNICDGDLYGTKWNTNDDDNAQDVDGHSIVFKLNDKIDYTKIKGIKFFSWSIRPTSIEVGSGSSEANAMAATLQTINTSYSSKWTLTDLTITLNGRYVRVKFNGTTDKKNFHVEDIFFIAEAETYEVEVKDNGKGYLTPTSIEGPTPESAAANTDRTHTLIYDVGDNYRSMTKIGFTLNYYWQNNTVTLYSSSNGTDWGTEIATEANLTDNTFDVTGKLTGRYIKLVSYDNSSNDCSFKTGSGEKEYLVYFYREIIPPLTAELSGWTASLEGTATLESSTVTVSYTVPTTTAGSVDYISFVFPEVTNVEVQICNADGSQTSPWYSPDGPSTSVDNINTSTYILDISEYSSTMTQADGNTIRIKYSLPDGSTTYQLPTVKFYGGRGDVPTAAQMGIKLAAYSKNIRPTDVYGVTLTDATELANQMKIYDSNSSTSYEIKENTVLYFVVDETVPHANISHIGLKFSEAPNATVEIKTTSRVDGDGGWNFINNENTPVMAGETELYFACDNYTDHIDWRFLTVARITIRPTSDSPATINLEDVTIYLTEPYEGATIEGQLYPNQMMTLNSKGADITPVGTTWTENNVIWNFASTINTEKNNKANITSLTLNLTDENTKTGMTSVEIEFEEAPNIAVEVKAAAPTSNMRTLVERDINTTRYVFDIKGKVTSTDNCLRLRFVPTYGVTPSQVKIKSIKFYNENTVADNSKYYSYYNKLDMVFFEGYCGNSDEASYTKLSDPREKNRFESMVDASIESPWQSFHGTSDQYKKTYYYIVFKLKNDDGTDCTLNHNYNGLSINDLNKATCSFGSGNTGMDTENIQPGNNGLITNVDIYVAESYTEGGLSGGTVGSEWTRLTKSTSDVSPDATTGRCSFVVGEDNGLNTPDDTKDYKYVMLALKTSTGLFSIFDFSLYTNTYVSFEGCTVEHKAAKYYDQYEKLGTTLQEDLNREENTFNTTHKTGLDDDGYQRAHTLTDTIYIHPGDSIALTIPDFYQYRFINNGYQRWYNYETDRNFYTGDNERMDILTPEYMKVTKNGYHNLPYNVDKGFRFANGYVGNPIAQRNAHLYSMMFYFPTDEEANKWFGEVKEEYVVACDVSNYHDFTESYSKESYKTAFWQPNAEIVYEPTLGSRFKYVIKDATKTPPPVEIISMTAPATRIPDYTNEMVALQREARTYITADLNSKVTSKDPLYVTLGDKTTAGIILLSGNNGTEVSKDGYAELTGSDRNIFFKYPESSNSDGTVSVPDGSIAEIIVTNGETVVAKFTITFVEEYRLLSQSQLQVIKGEKTWETNNEKNWKNLTHRYPTTLHERSFVTGLDFDYSLDLTADKFGGQWSERGNHFLPYPMEWQSSSYGFHDGAHKNDKFPYTAGAYNLNSNDVKWGYYGILSDDLEYDKESVRYNRSGTTPSRFSMHVDASDQPGVVARLPFNKALCKGSELFCSAWVRVARGGSQDNAGLLFSVIKINPDKTETVVHRHLTGQIPSSNAKTVKNSIVLPGIGEGKEDGDSEWFQVYFTFFNKSGAAAGDYVVQVDNVSASTNGADFYIDDIRIYVEGAEPILKQRTFVCEGDPTLMELHVDWNRFASRQGADENENTEDNYETTVDMCFYDQVEYERVLAQYKKDNNYDSANETEQAKILLAGRTAAIKAAIQEISLDGTTYSKISSVKHYYRYFKDGLTGCTNAKEYSYEGNNLLDDNGGFFYTQSNDKRLAFDFYSKMEANRSYIMLMVNHNTAYPDLSTLTGTELENALDTYYAAFASICEDACVMKSNFTMSAQNGILVNGEVLDPVQTYCEGQKFNFSAILRVPKFTTNSNGETVPVYDENGVQKYTELKDGDVQFDWFIGTLDTLTVQNSYCGNVTLLEALRAFRTVYPDAADLNVTAPNTVGSTTFNTNHLKLMMYYYNTHRLILYRDHLEDEIATTGLDLVVVPTTQTLTISNVVHDVCWAPIPISLLPASSKSPTASPGFGNIDYTKAQYDYPSLRIGLEQINAARTNGIVVDLRGVSNNTNNGISLIAEQKGLYLIGSNDPNYRGKVKATNFSSTDLSVGTLEEINVDATDPTTANMKIKFAGSDVFAPREGYYYTLQVHFSDGNTNNCYGSLSFDMKVVPEYVVWNGNETKNWNNDGNWVRANAADFKHTGSEYTDNNTDGNTSNAYVPMHFTKVIMKENSKAQLYAAGFVMPTEDNVDKNGDGVKDAKALEWKGEYVDDNMPSGLGAATDDIEYDLMAYENGENGLVTKKYRSNICEQIHLEPGAQLLHTEQLSYNKAWVEMLLPVKAWTLVSVPMLDVVAGDWYTWNTLNTDKSTQMNMAKEYFQDITFTESGGNRLNPAVYQRSWNGQGKVYLTSGDNDGATPTFTTAEWGAAYNDATVKYESGEGFSIKAADITGAAAEKTQLLFRFPKNDKNYNYPTTALGRATDGKLTTWKFGDRNATENYDAKDDYYEDFDFDPSKEGYLVTLTEAAKSDSQYRIVGNPFPAQLSLKAFFEANNDNLTGQYWETKAGETTSGGFDSDRAWLNSNGTTTDVLIDPYEAFFVEMKSDKTSVKFTSAMQVLGSSTSSSAKDYVMLSVSASNGAKSSSAAVGWSDGANDGFGDEDVELLRDPVIQGEDMPLVYTVAGDRAVSINSFANGGLIPLGVYGKEGQNITLTFRGVETMEGVSLYDAESLSDTELSEGYVLEVQGNCHGRYFLRTRGSDNIQEEVVGEPMLTVFSPVKRQLNVSSTEPIYNVDVYTVGGALQQRVDLQQSTALDGSQTTTHDAQTAILRGINSGVAIVHITTTSGVSVRKVHVK